MADLNNISDGLDLGPIEERLSKITGDKWKWLIDEETHQLMFKSGDFLIMMFPPGTFDGYRPYDNDREFIANAPTDITALLVEVKRLREVEEELRDRIDQMEYTCDHG